MERIEALVSVVVICRNVSDVLEDCVAEICLLLESQYSNYEVLLVDDNSEDETVARAEKILSQHYCVRLIALSRQMGTEIATMAGLESAIGDFVVVMDPEFDPPDQIIRMIEMVRGGQDIVMGVIDTTRDRGPLYQKLRGLYYAVAGRMIASKLIPGSTIFSALSRAAVNAITRIRHRKRLFSLVASETGYPLVTFPYEQRDTSGGRRQRGLLRSVRFGVSTLIHNSNSPLRLVSIVGLVGSLMCTLYCVYVIVVNIFKDEVMEGWTTLSLQLNGLFFLAFLMLALVGEYMARVLDESMDRPLYHVRGEKSSSIMISNATRRNVLEESLDEHQPEAAHSRAPVKPPTMPRKKAVAPVLDAGLSLNTPEESHDQ